MPLLRVSNASRGRVLGTRVRLANRWWQRLRGLLGAPSLEPGEGLLLTPCPSVHTFGMRFALDVAFLDREGRVVAVYRSLPPNRVTRLHREARFALELPAGGLGETSENDSLAWDAAGGPGAPRPDRFSPTPDPGSSD